ncbi:MAG: hypothetical protein QNJ97_17855 [Myxococcota bacterium]|nr:hypothetical protein [Myxococcota bacterium]
MPIQRRSGAPLGNIPLTLPGFRGLNKQTENSLLGPEWATELTNTVLDQANRVAARKGWASSTTTPLPGGAEITQVIEYATTTGTRQLIAIADDSALYRSTDNGETWTDVTGTATVTDTQMKLLNFNDKVVGLQDGDSPVVYSGTTFSDLTDSGNEPQGRAGASAFGRLWVASADGATLQYCGLLNEADWSGSDTGSFQLQNVWPDYDQITAVSEFNGALAVFGEENVVIYTDGQGSAVGLDPLQAYVVDTVSGIGCVARDSIQNVKGDLWFLSRDGMQSLARLVQEKSNPLINLSTNIQDYLIDAITAANIDLEDCRSVYSPRDRFYLLSLPVGSGVEEGQTIAFDTRGRLEDGSARVVGIWSGLVPRAITRRRNQDVVIAIRAAPGEVGTYSGVFQDAASSYTFVYESGWLDLTQQGLLIFPKILEGLLFLGQDTAVTFKWAFDFNDNFTTRSVSFSGVAGTAEYGVAEFAVAEYGASEGLRTGRTPGAKSGRYIKLGAEATISGGEVAIQQIDLYAKAGRLR